MDDDGAPDRLPAGLAVLVLEVPLAIGLCCETIVAELALKGFLSGVGSHVAGQGALVVTAVLASTDIANIGWTAQMLLVVALQRPKVGVDSITKAAGKFPLELHVPDVGVLM